jgi:pimeloyl-ACP methyl ester carboxylesterase
MPLALAGDIELSYERAGSGPPLLLIQGMGGTYLGPLREHFDLVVYDHRGVGESSRVRAPFTIVDLAQDASRLLDALGIQRVHVFGFSMGGMVAQELALADQRRIATLTLAATFCGGPGSKPARRGVLDRLADPNMSGDRERAMELAWQINVSTVFAANAEVRRRFLELARHRRLRLTVLGAQVQAIAGHDTSARLGGLGVPALVIHGTADQVIPVENGQMIARLIPGAALELLDGAGHMFFWEVPERAAGLVSRFVDSLSAS